MRNADTEVHSHRATDFREGGGAREGRRQATGHADSTGVLAVIVGFHQQRQAYSTIREARDVTPAPEDCIFLLCSFHFFSVRKLIIFSPSLSVMPFQWWGGIRRRVCW